MTRRSAPPSRRWVAKAWRSRCGWRSSRRTVLVSRRRPRADRKSVVRAGRERRPSRLQVARELECGLLAEGDDALLASLAADVHDLAVEVDVDEVERHRLLAP